MGFFGRAGAGFGRDEMSYLDGHEGCAADGTYKPTSYPQRWPWKRRRKKKGGRTEGQSEIAELTNPVSA